MKDKKHGRKAIINRILTVAFLFVFLFSLYKIVNIFLEYRNIDKLYDDTVTQYTSDEDGFIFRGQISIFLFCRERITNNIFFNHTKKNI